MEVHIEPTPSAFARRAASLAAEAVSANPRLVLALPTGKTPALMYSELARLHREDGLDFSGVRVFSLDEYLGVPATDPRSFHCYLWTNFLGLVNVRPQNVRMMPSAADDELCARYEDAIREDGGIDLLIAGVGANGHIAFNEPGSALDSRTRIVELADSTIEGLRSIFIPDELPRRAATIGIGTILEARRILVLASGESKRRAVAGLLDGPVTTSNPISAIRLHPDHTVVADVAAFARRLEPPR